MHENLRRHRRELSGQRVAMRRGYAGAFRVMQHTCSADSRPKSRETPATGTRLERLLGRIGPQTREQCGPRRHPFAQSRRKPAMPSPRATTLSLPRLASPHEATRTSGPAPREPTRRQMTFAVHRSPSALLLPAFRCAPCRASYELSLTLLLVVLAPLRPPRMRLGSSSVPSAPGVVSMVGQVKVNCASGGHQLQTDRGSVVGLRFGLLGGLLPVGDLSLPGTLRADQEPGGGASGDGLVSCSR